MKKLSFLALIIAGLLSLTSCGREPDKTFLVSALGFKNAGGNIRIYAEYIAVSDTDAKSGYTAEVAFADGYSVEAALNELAGKLTKKISLEHCAVVILDENLTAEQTGGIIEKMAEGRQLSLSVLLVCGQDTEGLFSAKTTSNPSVGYTLLSMLKSRSETFGYGSHIKLYEISTARREQTNLFALPFIALDGEKLTAEGMMLYKDDGAYFTLDTRESVYYAIFRNIYEGGEVAIGEGVVRLDKTNIKLEKTDEDVTAYVNIEKGEILDELNLFYQEMFKSGIDILDLGEDKKPAEIKIKGKSDIET